MGKLQRRGNKKERYEFVSAYPAKKYRCGLKAGDRLRIKKRIVIRDHTGKPTGKIHPAGEVWTVLPGARDNLTLVWIRQANGNRHTWDDDESIFRTFELIKPLDHKKRQSAGQRSAGKSRDLGEAMRHQFGEIIGERQLNRAGARSKDLTVTLGKPRRRKDGDWECPFRISGLGTQYGYGVDGIQALITALDGIRVMLERSAQRFSWLGGEPGYTGFDRFVTASLGEKFNKRLNLIIDREIAKFVYLLEQTHQKRKTTTRKKKLLPPAQ